MHTITVNGKKYIKTIGFLQKELQRWSKVDHCEYIYGTYHIRLSEGFKMENLNMTMNIICDFLDTKKENIFFDAQNDLADFTVKGN